MCHWKHPYVERNFRIHIIWTFYRDVFKNPPIYLRARSNLECESVKVFEELNCEVFVSSISLLLCTYDLLIILSRLVVDANQDLLKILSHLVVKFEKR